MMTPTKEEWKKIEEKLSTPWGQIVLMIDGYELTLSVVRVKPLRYAIMIYVNGVFKGEWGLKDCEERRLFFCPLVRNIWSRKTRKALKNISKKSMKSINMDLDKTAVYYTPFWKSFKSLKAHLLKNNKSIEWINKPEPSPRFRTREEGGL